MYLHILGVQATPLPVFQESGQISHGRRDGTEGAAESQEKDGIEDLHPRALVSKADLERHFRYSLAEAAAQLGVCKTTVKRACRYIHCLSVPLTLHP